MSDGPITAETQDLLLLRNVLARYREVSRKSWADIIGKETNEWRFELWGGQGTHGVGFKSISPKPQKIISSAMDRDFHVKRRSNPITAAHNGLSAAASAAADIAMGGQKFGLFRVEVNANGVFVKPIRFSAGPKTKILKGGRSGKKFSHSARFAHEVDNETASQLVEADPSIKVLNKRAVGVAIELSLRSRAAKGGTMALQWLGTNFSRRKGANAKSGPIVIRSSKGIPLGLVDFHGDGDVQVSTLTGLVPGTAHEAALHSVVDRVARVRIADRLDYITRKLEAAKKEALSVA